MTAIELTRAFLAVFFACVALFYTSRIVFERRRSGKTPVYSGTPGSLHYATHLSFRIFRAAILIVCIVRFWWPAFDLYLIPFYFAWHPAVLILGDLLLLSGFAGVVLVHFYMGKDWRSGSRAKDSTCLITTGPFAFSRNPMMLGVLVAQVGFFLALPTIFTLACLVIGIWAVNAQTRVEERVLFDRFGGTYLDYSQRTPRWLRLNTDQAP